MHYLHIGYSQQQDISATSNYSDPGASQQRSDSMSTDIIRPYGDASSACLQDAVQSQQVSRITSDNKPVSDDGNVLMKGHTPDDGSRESNEVSRSHEESSYLQGAEVSPAADAEVLPDPMSHSDENGSTEAVDSLQHNPNQKVSSLTITTRVNQIIN